MAFWLKVVTDGAMICWLDVADPIPFCASMAFEESTPEYATITPETGTALGKVNT